MTRSFWQSETFKIWLQYFAAGLAAFPGGLIYLFLLNQSINEKQTFRLAFAISVSLGLAAWFGAEKFLRSRFAQQAYIQETIESDVLVAPNHSPVFAAGALAIVIFCVGNPSSPPQLFALQDVVVCNSATTTPFYLSLQVD
jgi:hypothetical protein